MSDLHFTFLSEKDIPELHDAFLKAFADYVVPLKLNADQFSAKLKREGVKLPFCAAAYSGKELVGFILTGLGEWDGKPTAYNAGTGVLPAFRGQRITQQLYRHLFPKLLESGVEQCLLEVITSNTVAVNVYQQIGFSITRTFDCFRANKKDLLLNVSKPEYVTIRQVAKPDWKSYGCISEVQPGWQNTALAIKGSPEAKIFLEARDEFQELAGYAVFFPGSGAVAQFAVEAARRGKGIGTALLREVVRHTEAPALMFVNIDVSARQMIDFLQRRHLACLLRQYEMILPLG